MLKFNEIPKNSFIVVYTKKYAETQASVKDLKVPEEYKDNPSYLFGSGKKLENDFLVHLESKWTFTKVITDSPEFRDALEFELKPYHHNNYLRGYLEEESMLGIQTIKVYYYDGEKTFEVKYAR